MTDYREQLKQIRTFTSLVRFLRDELDWPVGTDDFEDLTFDYAPEELGIDAANAAKIDEIKRLRPLVANQPWGIFFVKFEPKQLPVVALRRILASVVVKKRATASAAEQPKWAEDDLLFISSYGEGDERKISFAHFSKDPVKKNELPTLKVLAWDELDTPLHLDRTANRLVERLSWPSSDGEWDEVTWRDRWRSAFDLKHREVITTSKTLAIRLAELARQIRAEILRIIEIETEDGKVTQLMKAFQRSLVHDLDPDRFADMYAQTIAYGLLSARIAEPDADTAHDLSLHMRTNPFLRELMETFLHVGDSEGAGRAGIDFDELGVRDIVELLDQANMEAVVLDFGDRNPLEDPVIHFYELFLKEYDAKKRMQRGVFYTPRPVVSYIVRSIDEVLRKEFGLSDGLADTTTWGEILERHDGLELPRDVEPGDAFVQILDPATGTGTFLVEVIDLVHRTMTAKWKERSYSANDIGTLWNDYVPRHLLSRLHGYELLMAPYAIAHLKVSLKLFETGYRFGSDERAGIFLTNALAPPEDFSDRLEFAIPALAHEAKAVNAIKRSRRFTVVIGNPPYAGHSVNNQVEWIVDKVYDYKRGLPDLKKPGQAKWLQDDYVKFIRLAQWCIAASDVGVVGFITNHSFLDNPTFRGMRKSVVDTFDHARFLDLHGNTKTRERRSASVVDENVFDIQQGVAISLLERRKRQNLVEHADFWGSRSEKYSALLKADAEPIPFSRIEPASEFHLLIPQDQDLWREYAVWPSIREIFSVNGDPAPGIVTTHDQFAIAFTEAEMREHVDELIQTESEEEARALFRLCTQSQWSYTAAKADLAKGEWLEEVGQILYRPFDVRWTVYNPHVAVHRRERVMRHLRSNQNVALITTRAVEIGRGFEHVFCTRLITQHHSVSNKEVNYVFPLFLVTEPDQLHGAVSSRINIAPEFLRSVADVLQTGMTADGLPSGTSAEDLFAYCYAILHSRGYRRRYDDLLRIEFPRLPLPPNRDVLATLVNLGQQLIDCHLMDVPRQEAIGANYVGPTAPQITRVGWADGAVWLDAPTRKKQAAEARGTIGFVGVSDEVWDFHIGGYRVCEKWLKDRKGRTLSREEIHHYLKLLDSVRRTIDLMDEIDDAIQAAGGWPDAFVTTRNQVAAA